jgi:hypothetical protein
MLFSQRKLFVSFIIAKLFLLVVAVISYQNTERSTATVRQVGHTLEAIRITDLLKMDLLKAEYAPPTETRKPRSRKPVRALKHLFQTNPSRVRKGRREERKKPTHAHKLRYHRYTKRVLA